MVIGRRTAFAVLLAAHVLGACRSAAPAPRASVPAASPAPTPAPAIPDATHWVRTSAEYRALALQTYRAATRALEERVAGRLPGTWGVILDADETVLDNSQYQKEQGGRPFDAASWTAWVARREAGAVPGAKAFVSRVRELGGRIAIVTNRTLAECPDTEANFRALDLPWDLMLCKGEVSAKEPRFEQVAKGGVGGSALEVLLFVGDNIQDFPGQRQSLRDGPDDAFSDFGRRYFVVPNPMYGSWERNPPR
jgi:5'-nucleotidase (lipoprotein e(P4) family)